MGLVLLANDFRAAMQEVKDADAGKFQLMDAEDLLYELTNKDTHAPEWGR